MKFMNMVAKKFENFDKFKQQIFKLFSYPSLVKLG